LEEAEAAHMAQGQHFKEAREAKREQEKEATQKKSERGQKATKESRLLHAQLQSQLQQLAAADTAAAHAFASQRAQMARESQAIAQKLLELQNTP